MKAVLFRTENEITHDWIDHFTEEALRLSHKHMDDLNDDIDAMSNNPDILEFLDRSEDDRDSSIPLVYKGIRLNPEDELMNYTRAVVLDRKGRKKSWKKLKKWLKELICQIIRDNVGDDPKSIFKKVIDAVMRAIGGNIPAAIVGIIVILLAQVFKIGMPKWCSTQLEKDITPVNLDISTSQHTFGIKDSGIMRNVKLWEIDTIGIKDIEFKAGKTTYEQKNPTLSGIFKGVLLNIEKGLRHYKNYIALYNNGATDMEDWDLYISIICYDPDASSGTDAHNLFKKLKEERKNLASGLFRTNKKDASGDPIYTDEAGFIEHIRNFPYSLATQLVYKGVGLKDALGQNNEYLPILNIGDLCPENCPKAIANP